MRRTITYPFLALGLFLFCWINLPKSVSDQLRSWTLSSLNKNSPPSPSQQLERLQLENQNLRRQIEQVSEWVLFMQRLGEEIGSLKEPSCQKRAAQLHELLRAESQALPAQVIYRDPSSWSSSLWVNIGEENNRALGRTVIAKNSPVLSEGALVGVVDHVGKRQARIRLITDSGLSPAVRVNRGASQNRELAHQLQKLLEQLEKRSDLFSAETEKQHLLSQLKALKERSGVNWEDGYLAKGEVHGSSAPFWRSRSPMLKGIGFNYDYPDEDGPPADTKPAALLKEGDWLVTSGLDGVFPRGLPVGRVMFVHPKKEGAYAYEVDVRPAASNLNDLETVFILPALSE